MKDTLHLDPVNVTRTNFSLGNVVISIVLVLGIPLLLRTMARPGGDDLDHLPHLEPPAPTVATRKAGNGRSLADWANRSRAIPGLIVYPAQVQAGHERSRRLGQHPFEPALRVFEFALAARDRA